MEITETSIYLDREQEQPTDHLEAYDLGNGEVGIMSTITDARGIPIESSQLTPSSIVTIDGVSGQVGHMIEAGLLDESVYTDGLQDTSTPESNEAEQEQSTGQLHDTAAQLEETIGFNDTLESVGLLLAGESLDAEVVGHLCDTFGIHEGEVVKEMQSMTNEVYGGFLDHAEQQHGITNEEHFRQWVSYAVHSNTKTRNLYQQAVTGALHGEYSHADDLVRAYKSYYKL